MVDSTCQADESCCVPPHPSRYALDTFSRLGEGFYGCAVFMLVGRSIQQSQTDTNDQCIQPCPRGTLIADQRRACAARPKGKNEESPGWSLLRTERFKFFPATGAHSSTTSSFIQAAFTSHTAFFDSFLGSKKESFPPRSLVPPPFPSYFLCSRVDFCGKVWYPIGACFE